MDQQRSIRIKRLVEESGKSYQELEKITGIKRSSLQRYASGTTGKIPLDAIEKLAKAFSVPATYLMGWEETEVKASIKNDLDVSEELNIILDSLRDTERDMTVDGKPLDPETKALLIASLENSLRMARVMNSRKGGSES